jgi:hypothetical protein
MFCDVFMRAVGDFHAVIVCPALCDRAPCGTWLPPCGGVQRRQGSGNQMWMRQRSPPLATHGQLSLIRSPTSAPSGFTTRPHVRVAAQVPPLLGIMSAIIGARVGRVENAAHPGHVFGHENVEDTKRLLQPPPRSCPGAQGALVAAEISSYLLATLMQPRRAFSGWSTCKSLTRATTAYRPCRQQWEGHWNSAF